MNAFLIRDLTRDEREYFEERAGILEFCGLLSRQEAERMAYEDIQKIRKAKRLLAESGHRKAA